VLILYPQMNNNNKTPEDWYFWICEVTNVKPRLRKMTDEELWARDRYNNTTSNNYWSNNSPGYWGLTNPPVWVPTPTNASISKDEKEAALANQLGHQPLPFVFKKPAPPTPKLIPPVPSPLEPGPTSGNAFSLRQSNSDDVPRMK
jgi:hypothetical protein